MLSSSKHVNNNQNFWMSFNTWVCFSKTCLGFEHCTHIIHGKTSSVPVQRRAQLPQLMIDAISLSVSHRKEEKFVHIIRDKLIIFQSIHSRVLLKLSHSLVLPLPDLLDEVLSPQIMSAQLSLFHQFLLHHNLCGDTSVIAAGIPQCGLSSHPVPVSSHQSKAKITHIIISDALDRNNNNLSHAAMTQTLTITYKVSCIKHMMTANEAWIKLTIILNIYNNSD